VRKHAHPTDELQKPLPTPGNKNHSYRIVADTTHFSVSDGEDRSLFEKGTSGKEGSTISVPDAEAVLRAANLNFVSFCEKEYPIGSIAQEFSSVAKLHGEEVLRHSSRDLLPGVCKAALEHLPEKIVHRATCSVQVAQWLFPK
jgi:hypothetical protein